MMYIDVHGNRARIVKQDQGCVLKFYNRRGKLRSSLELDSLDESQLEQILKDNGFIKNNC